MPGQTIQDAAWYSALRPYIERDDLLVDLRAPLHLGQNTTIAHIPSCFLRLPRWTGQPFVDDFGKKRAAMVELDGEHLFAELAILRLLERDGWQGRWVNTYSGRGEVWKYLTRWRDVPRKEQMSRPIAEEAPRHLLSRIAQESPNRFTGCWDVFAWKDNEYAFLEAKMQTPKYKDQVSEFQETWLKTALQLRDSPLRPSSFTFVQWDYVP